MAETTANLGTLFTAIQQQLSTCANLNQYSVFMNCNDQDTDPEIADNYISICPGTFSVDQRTLTGGSNIDLYLIGQFTLTVRNRLDLDAGLRQDGWFNDPSLGFYGIINNLVNCFNMFQVTNSSGILTPVPIRLLEIQRPVVHKSTVMVGTAVTIWHLEFAASVTSTSIPYAPTYP
jgi:hypothetical protein